jgi:hypothetical protein
MSGSVGRRARTVLLALLALPVSLVWAAGPAHAEATRAPISVKVFAPTATVAHAASISVTVTRGRIASLKVTTDGLTALSDWSFSGRTATGPVIWHTPGTGRVTVQLTLSSGRVVSGTTTVPVAADTTVDPSLPQFQLVYVYPSDRAPVDGRARAIAHEAEVVDQWFASQLSGASPRFAVNLVGAPSVLTIAAPLAAAQLSASSDIAAELVARWRVEGVIGPATIPIVYVDGTQTKLPSACGWYETPADVIVLPLGNCAIEPAERTVFPFRSTAILAHEIVHSLGALTDQAARPDGSGRHTTDDPTDIMYNGPKPHDWENLTLDPGKDDYVGGTAPADGIQLSPLLEDDDDQAAHHDGDDGHDDDDDDSVRVHSSDGDDD